MADLSAKFMGLNLKSPIIAGSCGLTKSYDNLKKIEENGAGAIVLKSLFEEQIRFEVNKIFNANDVSSFYQEVEDYISNYCKEAYIENHLDLISRAKKNLSIPIIASINCYTAKEWTVYAKKIQEAGADALELNLFVLPSDPHKSSSENENTYFEIINEVLKHLTIPVAIKISPYFSALAQTIEKLSNTGISGLVLFNRFFKPDIDIEKFNIIPSNVFSSSEEITTPLRWIAILSSRIKCNIAGSTGVHDGKDAVKLLLAGANAVQVCSTLYKNGFEQIKIINDEIENWMKKHKFNTIDDFRGKMSTNKVENPAVFQRIQFMKHFAGIE